MHIFFLVFSMPWRGSILDFRSDRSTSSKSFQKELKKKRGDKEKRWFYFWNETADGFHERISYEQSWISWWEIKYWSRYASTNGPINAAAYGSLDNDTYGSHISTNLSTFTSTTISSFILHRSTISWFVSTTSTMIVSFDCISTYLH